MQVILPSEPQEKTTYDNDFCLKLHFPGEKSQGVFKKSFITLNAIMKQNRIIETKETFAAKPIGAIKGCTVERSPSKTS
jgi:hypothetical protein